MWPFKIASSLSLLPYLHLHLQSSLPISRRHSNVRAMDSNWRLRVDLSQFFLFEATGDSELNSGDDDISAVDNDEDDAESCCSGPCGSLDDFMGCHQDHQGINNGDCNGFDDPDYHINQENGSYSEEVEMEHQQEKQGRASGDGNDNGETQTQTLVLNEMEKNKLFWETCLAS